MFCFLRLHFSVNNRGRQAFKPQPPNEASGEAPRLYKEAFDTSSKQFNSLYAIAQQVRGGSSSDGSAKAKYPKSEGVDEKAASSDLDKKYEKPSYGRPHGLSSTSLVIMLGWRLGLGMPNNYRPSYGSPHATGKPPLWAPGGNRRNAYAGQKLKKFTSDYDFETANKKFEEITLSDEHDDPDGNILPLAAMLRHAIQMRPQSRRLPRAKMRLKTARPARRRSSTRRWSSSTTSRRMRRTVDLGTHITCRCVHSRLARKCVRTGTRSARRIAKHLARMRLPL